MRVNSIQVLINETKKCLKNECNLSALITALIIPDLCGKILYPDDNNSQRYKKWFDKYIGNYEQNPFDKEKPKDEQLPYMNGEVMYKLRCAMFHEGSDDISSKISIDEFNLRFGKSSVLESASISQRALPKETKIMHSKVIKWNINTYQICEKLIKAAELFLKLEVDDLSKIPTINILPDVPDIFKVKK